MEKDQFLWVEKYRPHKIADCILPDTLKKTFQDYVKKGEIPNLLLCGGPGMGKTTVAKALCDEIECDWIYINGSDESGIDTLRNKIKGYASTVSLTGGKKVIILDEADYLNPNSLQPALRGAIEEFASNCSFIFTCNYKNRIIEPLHSRCAVIEFKISKTESKAIAAKFFIRVLEILDKEKIKYDKPVVVNLIMKYFPDFRRVLNELQRYSSSGEINESVLSQISDVEIKDLIKFLKDKDFQKVRKWVNENDFDVGLYRRLYDDCYNLLKSSSIPQAVLIIAKYQYQQAFSADIKLNVLACMVELMIELDWN